MPCHRIGVAVIWETSDSGMPLRQVSLNRSDYKVTFYHTPVCEDTGTNTNTIDGVRQTCMMVGLRNVQTWVFLFTSKSSIVGIV